MSHVCYCLKIRSSLTSANSFHIEFYYYFKATNINHELILRAGCLRMMQIY